MSTKRICKNLLAIGSHFGIKGVKGAKNDHVYGFVIFYLILMIFFFV